MASKAKRRRKVLGASCILAALIIAGSSFAWFTSKDEVTNRLTASSNYGVTIAEDFTPPENWIPGQEINKDVGVVNTGNVDAFARVWLEGEFNLVKEGNGITATPAAAYAPDVITDNDKMKNLGFEEVTVANTKSYVKVLSKDKTINANNHNTNKTDPGAYSEVQAMQAGGFLAYAPTGAKYKYTLNQNKAVDVYYDDSNHAVTDIVAGSTVIVGDNAAAPSGTTYIAPPNTAGDIDSQSFLPMTTGLYLFRRNVDVDNGKTDKDWEYSGYYYVAAANDIGGQGKYYALKTKVDGTELASTDTVYVDGIAYNDGDDVTPNWYVDQQTGAITSDSALTDVKLFTAEQSKVTDDYITWTYTEAGNGTPAKLTATVAATSLNAAQKLSVDVALANIGDDTNQWHRATAGNVNERDTFYYTNDIEEGDTTQKLVDSVTLNKDTKQTAYIAFDFDLNVKMDSIQVTIASDGKEAFDTVKDGWGVGSTKAVAQKAEAISAPEINRIVWASARN